MRDYRQSAKKRPHINECKEGIWFEVPGMYAMELYFVCKCNGALVLTRKTGTYDEYSCKECRTVWECNFSKKRVINKGARDDRLRCSRMHVAGLMQMSGRKV